MRGRRAVPVLSTLSLAVLAFAAPAAAQTTLVSNEDHIGPSGSNVFTAISFTTGTQGATISDIQIRMSSTSGGTMSVVLREDNAGEPGDLVATFTNPASLPINSFVTFTAPASTTVAASTTYWVSVHEGITGTRASYRTASGNEESGVTGWSLGDGRKWRQSETSGWNDSSSPLVLKIRGTLTTTTTEVPGAPDAPTVAKGSTSGKLSVKWSEPANSGTITDYDLRYFQGSSDPSDDDDWVMEGAPGLPDPATSDSVEIAGLLANSAYRVQVRAENAAGEGSWSTSGSATTDTVPTVNNAPRVMRLVTPGVSGPQGQCELVTNSAIAADTLDNVRAGVASLTLVTRETETTEWPTSCNAVGNTDAPVFDDRDADDLVIAIDDFTPLDNVRFFPVSTFGDSPVIDGGRLWASGIAAFEQTYQRVDLTAVDEHGASVSTHVYLGVRVFANTSAPSFSETVGLQSVASGAAITPIVLPTATGGDTSAPRTGGDPIPIPSPYFYDVSGLPDGFSFDASTREITGTPTTDGLYTVTYTAEDADAVDAGDGDLTDTAVLTFDIKVGDQPAISSVTISSTPSLDGDTYGRGETIVVDVAFDANIQLTGDEDVRIRLDLGTDDDNLSNSRKGLTSPTVVNQNTLRYEYTVKASDMDSDGVWVQTQSATNDRVLFYAGTGKVVLAGDTSVEAILTKSGLPTTGDENHKVDGSREEDTTPPAVSRATVNGTALTLRFDEALKSGTAPGTGRFTLSGTAGSVSVTAVAIGTNTREAVLTLSPAVGAGETGILLSYAKGSDANPLQDGSGNEAADFTDLSVANWTPDSNDMEAPALVAATIDGSDVTLSFSEPLDETSTITASGFTFSPSGLGAASNVSVDGTEITLETATAATASQTVTVSVSATTAAQIDDINGNALAEVSSFSVTNITGDDPGAPTFFSGFVVDYELELNFDVSAAPLHRGRVPPPSAFAITIDDGSTPPAVEAVAITGDRLVALTLNRPPTRAGTSPYRVSYDKSGLPRSRTLQNPWGTEADAFTNQAINVNTPALVPDSLRVDGATLTLLLNRPADPAYRPPGSLFEVEATDSEGTARTIAGTSALVAISHDTLRVTLSEAVTAGDSVTMGSYVDFFDPETDPTFNRSDWIRDFGDNRLEVGWAPAVARIVENRTPAAVAEASVNHQTLTLTFDADLDTTTPPATTRFTVAIAGETAPTVTAAAFHGSDDDKVELTLSAAVAPDETGMTVSYAAGSDANPLTDANNRRVADFSGVSVTNRTPPSDAGVRISSTPAIDTDNPADGVPDTYGAGDVVRVELTYSGAVAVDVTGGTPRLKIRLAAAQNTDERWADYESGTGTTKLIFAYTVASADASTAGVAVVTSSLELRGGTIKSTAPAATDAALHHRGVNNDDGHKVNGSLTAPPAFGSATVNGRTLTIAFSKALDTNSLPAGSAFSVQVAASEGGGGARTIAGTGTASITESTVTVTLASPVLADETVTVSYVAPANNPLQESGGTAVADFADQETTNNSTGTPNAAPSFPASAPSTLSVRENSGAGTAVGTVSATDGDGDALTYSLAGADAGSFEINASTGAITVAAGATLTAGATLSVTVQVTDGKAEDGTIDTAVDATRAVSIRVTGATSPPPSTRPPSAPAAPSVSAASETSLSVSWSAPSNLGTASAVADYDLRYYAGSADPANAADWIEEGEPNGPPDPGTSTSAVIAGLEANTAYRVQVRARGDGESAWSPSGAGTTDSAAPANQAPSFASSEYAFDLEENVAGSVEPVELGAVSATDPDGDALAYELAVGDAERFAVDSSDGTVRYVGPGEDYEAEPNLYELTVRASDPAGESAEAHVTVTVVNVVELPVAADDAVETDEDVAVEIDVLANDADPEGIGVRVASVSAAANGTVEVTAGGGVLYTPDPNWYGTDGFTYVLEDGNGGTSEAAVEVTVAPVNDLPEPVDDEAATDEDVTVEVDVLANDTDVDGDSLRVSSVSAPSNGTAAVTATGVRYTPAANWYGTDAFTYEVDDGNGGTAEAAVEVTVAPVNDVPEAADDAASTLEDEAVTVDVLANDTDADGDGLRVSSVTAPSNGTAAVAAGGVLYTPAADWHGTDSFTYEVDDGNGATATAVVTVTVVPVNDAPVAVGAIPDQSLEERGEPARIELGPFFEDTDGDALAYVTASSDSSVVAPSVAGTVLTLAPAGYGMALVVVAATDPGGLTATHTVRVGVSDRAAREVVSHALAGLARSHLASARMTLGRRATASRSEASRLSLLGRDVPLGKDAAKSAAERMWSSWRSGVTSRAMSQAAPYAARGANRGGMPGAGGLGMQGAGPNAGGRNGSNDMSLGELFRFADLVPRFKGGRDPLRGSEFQFAFGGGRETGDGQEADGGGGGLRFQLWGQGDVQTFQGAPSSASDYDGELQTGYVGVDTRLNDRWLLGVAVARSRGTGNWRAGGASGSLETRLVAVHPYLQWSSGATSLWATAGAGWGDADNVRDRGGRTEASGLGLRLGLVELRRRLAAGGGFELGLRAAAGWAELATDIGTETLDSQAAAVNQLRLGAEMSQRLRLGGLSLTPFGEAHVRRDGGAGQPGTGLELSGGLRAQAGFLRIDAQGRLLAVHSATGYEERGLGLTLSLGSPGGEGPSLSVAPRWGDLAAGGDALWQEQLYSRYAPASATADGARAAGTRNPWTLDLRGGYGLRIPGGRLLTWSGSLNHSATGPRFTAALQLGLGNASGDETGAEGTNGMVP